MIEKLKKEGPDTNIFYNVTNYLPLIIFFVLFILFSIFIPSFFSFQNVSDISRQIAITGILAAGMTLTILSGGIDLSVGSILALSITIGGFAIDANLPIWLVFIIILITGLFLGFVNGFLVTYLSILPLIVTLATLSIYRSLALLLTSGSYFTTIPNEILILGKGYFPILILIIVYIIVLFITQFTKFGRNIFSIGGNETAAISAGVPVNRYKIYIYSLSGLLSAVAGLIFIGRTGYAAPQVGEGYEFLAIAAVVVGGTNILGGEGHIFRTLLGTLIIGILVAGISMFGVNPSWQDTINGGIILFAITLEAIRSQKNKRRTFEKIS